MSINDYDPFNTDVGPIFGSITGTRGSRLHIIEALDLYLSPALCGMTCDRLVEREGEEMALLLAGKPSPADAVVPDVICRKCLMLYRLAMQP